MRYPLLMAGWLMSDIILFVGAYALAYMIRVGWIFSSDFPFNRFLVATLLAAPVWILALITTRSFALTRNQATLRSAAYIAYAALVGMAAFTLLYYFLFETFFSRLLLLLAFVLSAATGWLWHILYERILRTILTSGTPVFPTLIVGVTRESRALIAALNARRNPLKPVAVLDAKGVPDTAIDGVPVRGKLNKLEETLEQERITHLIQCSDIEQSLNLLSACRTRGITYMILPSVFGMVERDERIETLEGVPTTVVRPKASPWSWLFW